MILDVRAEWARRCLLVAAIAGGAISARPAGAQVPVTDNAAHVSLATQVANQVKQLAALAQQITSLTQLVSLATVASTVLGDTVDPAMTGLFNDLQTAYGNSMQAYGSIMSIPAKIDQQIALFTPPPGGWDSMTFPQLVARARQLQALTLGTNSAVVANQANQLARQVEIAQQAARANAMADGAISALSATQAVAQQGRVAAMILQNIERTNENIATAIANKVMAESADRDIDAALAAKDIAAMKATIAQGPGTMTISPLTWGR